MTVSIVLDRYGHLLEGHDVDVLARLDTLATRARPPVTTGPGGASEPAFPVRPRRRCQQRAVTRADRSTADTGCDSVTARSTK